ncbi:MAG TPA: hypothetical protein DCY00_00695 [Actinobacteria bacterium]|nr:hypothetical protein [Actinomycetota bacterium]
MKIPLDCIPCQIRHFINSARMFTDDENIISSVLDHTLSVTSKYKSYDNIFKMYIDANRIIEKIGSGSDPYKEFKKQINSICLDAEPDLKKIIRESATPFETALRISIAGNSIDVMQQGNHISSKIIKNILKTALNQEISSSAIKKLYDEIVKAEKILFIGDNCGEIVLDRIFIEYLRDNVLYEKIKKITYAVRGGPALNDSTIEDAESTGMSSVVEVTTTGASIPAAYLPYSSEEFRKIYFASDLIISKGQGNFEGLFDRHENIFFMLKIKCPTFERFFGNKYKVGDIIIEQPL